MKIYDLYRVDRLAETKETVESKLGTFSNLKPIEEYLNSYSLKKEKIGRMYLTNPAKHLDSSYYIVLSGNLDEFANVVNYVVDIDINKD